MIVQNLAVQRGQWLSQSFLSIFGCQNDTLKFCNDTINSESQDMVLPCIEVKRIEESMSSCTRLLQF